MTAERITRIDGIVHFLGKPLPPGPWHAEPDHVDFEHEGLSCILHRGPSGAWCGYVAVPPSHPWHGKGYDDVRSADGDWVSVHGGLTYADKCQGSICHVAKPGEPDDVWWLGFDCAHHLDLGFWDLADMGGRPSRVDHPELGWVSSYRSVDYVRRETLKLAEQAKAVSP